MKHPLAYSKTYVYYLIIWVIIVVVHIGILHLYYDHSVTIAIQDAFVFNGIIALLGYAFGFAFYYISVDSESINTFVSYLALILVGAASAYFASDTLLRSVFIVDEVFLSFINEARLWRISASGFYFTSILIAYYFIQYNVDLSERKQNETKLETLLKETELNALKSQINPHFIFNSLNSVSSLTITSPEKAQEMVIKLSDFLRYSLGNNNDQFSSLSEELNNISLYLEIEKVRFGDRLDINNIISDAANNAKVPTLILQPLYENAIKYGLYETFDKVEIETKANLQDKVLSVTISNSFDPSSVVKKGKGIGLQNIQERLKIHFGSDKLLIIKTEGNRFIATIEIPQEIEPS